MLEIRKAYARDAERAAEVIAAALAEHKLPFEPEGRDADVKFFGARAAHDDLVAEDGMRFLGVVSVGPHGDPGVAWVSKLFVVASARRRGVGRKLLEKAHDAARGRGYTSVALRTRVIFVDAIRLYEALGYARAGGEQAGDVVYARPL